MELSGEQAKRGELSEFEQGMIENARRMEHSISKILETFDIR